jgi:hypothetical protein
MYKICIGEGNDLGFILQASKGGREQNTIVVYLKAQTGRVLFFSKAFEGVSLALEGKQIWPLHHMGSF